MGRPLFKSYANGHFSILGSPAQLLFCVIAYPLHHALSHRLVPATRDGTYYLVIKRLQK